MIVTTNDDYYKDIADAIREKTGGEEAYLPSEMGDGVRAIQSGGTEKATMIQLPPSHFMSGQSMFMNGSGMTSWYCDFGKPITIAVVKIVKTATSNRFRVGFFTTNPATATGTSLSGLECYSSSGDGTSPAGTSKDLYVSSSYNPRYMVVTVSNENTSTPAPDTWFVELQTN